MDELNLGNNNKNIFDKNCTNQLKGIAIILIILSHLGVLKHAGAWGVTIFLLLSGFGLTRSYYKSGVKNFFQKKISKILIPYSLITLIWILIDPFIYHNNYQLSTIFLSLIGFDFNSTLDKSMWYITYIFIWYIVFYFVFKFTENDKIKIVIMFLFSIVLYKYRSIFPEATGSGLYFAMFPIGILLGLLYSRILEIKNLRSITFFLSIICFMFFFITIIFLQGSIFIMLESLMLAFGCLGLFSLLSMYSFKANFLLFIGNISFEMYLLEYAFINRSKYIFNISLNSWYQQLLCIVVIILCSVIFKKLIDNLHLLLNNHKVKKVIER